MSGSIFNVPELNLHTQQAYPLADTATARDVTDSFSIPNDFLVGLYLSVPISGDLDPARFYLSGITTTPVGYQLTLAYDNGTTSVPVAQASILRQGLVDYAAIPLVGLGSFSDVTGTVVVGFLSSIDQQPAGRFLFDRAGGQLDLDCVRPTLRGLRSIAVSRNGVTGAPHFGTVVLQQGAGLQLTPTLNSGQLRIRIDVTAGTGMVAECPCTSDGAAQGSPILAINGVPADIHNNLQIATNSCFSLVPIEGGLLLQDNCTQPCCGCNETKDLQADLLAFQTARRTLQDFAAQLEAQFTQFQSVVLASRLSTNTCA